MTKIADETLHANLSIEMGNITMGANSREASLHFNKERIPPPSMDETHVTLKVTGDGFTGEIELDGYHLDGLDDALHHYREELEGHYND